MHIPAEYPIEQLLADGDNEPSTALGTFGRDADQACEIALLLLSGIGSESAAPKSRFGDISRVEMRHRFGTNKGWMTFFDQNGQAVFYVRIFFGYSPKRDQLAVSLLWEAGVELADINAARLRVDGESYKLIFSREKTVNLDGRRVVWTRGKLRRKWTWLEAN